jgi:MSHA biogenesis protein MshM
MPVITLESLRLLTNLETERRKLIQVVLFGQPELNERLDRASVRQLKQRITFSCALKPLTRADTEYYLAHRLGVAGYRGPGLFSADAVRRLHKGARGVPRLVNILAHKALMAAFGEGAHAVGVAQVRAAIADTESLDTSGRLHKRLLRYAALAGALLLASAGALVWGHLV